MDEVTNIGDHFKDPEGRSKLRKAARFAIAAIVTAAALAAVAKKVSSSDSTEQE